MIDICEVRDKCPDKISTFVMEDSVHNNLEEIHRYMTENETETNLYAMKMLIEEYQDDQYNDEKPKKKIK